MRKRWLLLVGPFLLYWLGAGLNIIAVSVNHGVMPVLVPISWPDAMGISNVPGTILDEIHIAWPATVHLAVLCDIFTRRGTVFSLGDICLWISEFITPYMIGAWLALEANLNPERW